jgi:hypothetical protein
MISVVRSPGIQMSALLYNFENSSDLKPEHLTWIRTTLHPWTTIRDIGMLVVGLTSRTGSDALNMKLSKARADAVSRELFLLSRSMPIETTTWVGEKAAAIVGVQDDVEDQRWRAVWVNIGDTRTPVQLPQPTFVERRTAVTILLKEEQKNFGGTGEPGEKSYQASQSIRRATGMTDGILGETKKQIDERFVLTGIEIERSNSSHGIPVVSTYEIEYLHVRYEWGPWDTRSPRNIKFTYKKLMQPDGPPKDSVRTIDPHNAEEWLKRPLWAYNNIE